MNSTPTVNPPQIIAGHCVRVTRSKSTGQRFARIDEHHSIPLDLCALAAGKDAWMRQIVCRCSYCDTREQVGNMEQGPTCQKCFDAQGEENARLDGSE